MSLFSNPLNGKRKLDGMMKYADDYRTELCTDSKGRTRERVVYTGEWTVIRSDEKTAKRCILTGAACAFVSVFSLIAAQFQNHMSGRSFFVVLPLAAALFPALYLLMALFKLPYRLKPMKRDEYDHGFLRAFRSLTAMGILTAAAGIAGIIVRVVYKDWMFLKGDVVYMFCMIAGITFAVLSFILLRKPDTTEKPNSYYTSC